MTGTTAFMETGRAGHRAAARRVRGQRRAPGLRPLPVHRGLRSAAVQACRCSSGTSSMRSGSGSTGRSLREAQQRKDAMPPTSSCTPLWRARRRPMTSLLGLDVGTSSVKGVAVDGGRRRVAGATAQLPAHSTPRPRLERAGSRGLVSAQPKRCSTSWAARTRPGIGLAGQMHVCGPRRHVPRCAPPFSGTRGRTQAPSARTSRSASGRERLDRAHRQPALAGFTAPKLLWMRRARARPVRAHRSTCSCPRTTCASC